VKKLLAVLLAIFLWGSAADLAMAQDSMKPLVTVSFSGYDKLFSNIGAIGEMGSNPDLGKGLEMMLKLMTQGKGLSGLDTTRPWGAVVLTDGQDFVAYGFLPVTNLSKLLDLFKDNPQFGDLENNNGVYRLQFAGSPDSFFIQQKNKWAVITNNESDLAKAPSDPTPLLGNLPERYDLAVQISIKNAPAMYRDVFLAQIQAGAQVGMEQRPDESDEDYALRSNMGKQAMDQASLFAKELDEVLLGWKVDTKNKTTYLELEATAQPGGELAKQFAQVKKGKTRFGGFLDSKATINGVMVNELSDNDVAQVQASLVELRKRVEKELDNQGLDDDQTKLSKQVLADAADILEKTLAAKKLEVGLLIDFQAKNLSALAAASIVDGNKINSMLKSLVAQEVKNAPDIEKLIKLDAEVYEGIHFHSVAIPTDENTQPLFGDHFDIVLGVANDALYAAVGNDAVKQLKDVIAKSKTAGSKDVLPLQVSVATGSIAKFTADMAEDEETKERATMFAEAMEKTKGKDHIFLTSTPVPNGIRIRVEAEEGLLVLLGSLGQMMNGEEPAGTEEPAETEEKQ
jgi:Fe-S cluster assembly iron-binding protein IscA